MTKTVTAAYAKAHLPELLNTVAKGNSIVISRYKKPVAMISPAPEAEKPEPKYGTGKGKARLIDPHAFDPMTEDEANAFLDPSQATDDRR